MRFLLDTNVLSEPLKPRPRPKILERMTAHATELATAALVWHELRFGCSRLPDSRRRRTVEAYLEDVVRATIPVLGYDGVAAEWHARERARLERAGQVAAFVDGQIASIAAVHGLVLVTRNVKDFRRFKDLQVADWSR